LSTALWRFWHTRGYLSEGVRWLDRAIVGSKQAASAARVRALEGMGWLTQYQGDTQRAETTYEAMLELSRRLDDKANIATALNSPGTLAVEEGDNERAKSLLEENLAVLRELNDEGDAATTLERYHTLNLLAHIPHLQTSTTGIICSCLLAFLDL
jgi:tetratricopeptide (TPR) repeat protein